MNNSPGEISGGQPKPLQEPILVAPCTGLTLAVAALILSLDTAKRGRLNSSECVEWLH